jgi:hypothetical protein
LCTRATMAPTSTRPSWLGTSATRCVASLSEIQPRMFPRPTAPAPALPPARISLVSAPRLWGPVMTPSPTFAILLMGPAGHAPADAQPPVGPQAHGLHAAAAPHRGGCRPGQPRRAPAPQLPPCCVAEG